MGVKRGLWIDHRVARIVTLTDEASDLQTIESNVERRVRASGGSRTVAPYGPQDVVAEDRIFRKYLHHLEAYYDRVIDAIRDSDRIYIFGPGEAKQELCKQMEKSKELSNKIKKVDTTDKMTETQIISAVKKFFKVE